MVRLPFAWSLCAKVRQSFQAQDSDSDGVVDYRQFRAALKVRKGKERGSRREGWALRQGSAPWERV